MSAATLVDAVPQAERRRAVRKKRASRLNTVVLSILAVIAAVGIAIQVVPDWNGLYATQDLMATFRPPLTEGHLLGTDNLGRDLLWRLVAGLGVSVMVGLTVAALSIVLGLVVGILAGFFGRASDAVATAVIDVTWAFPAVLLAIVLAGWAGPGLVTASIALAMTGWAAFARIVRGEVMALRERDFVLAARLLGVSRPMISVRHLLPYLMPNTIVMAVFFVSSAIIGEAGLSFLGLGAQAPMSSLGIMLAEGRDYLNVSWWPVVLGGALLVLVIYCLNALGDDLRDLLDPRSGVRK